MDRVIIFTSVVNPDTLNLDPIQDFGPIWIRIHGYVISVEKELLESFLGEKCLNKVFFLKQPENDGTGRGF